MTWALLIATVKKWGALFGLAAAAIALLIARLSGIQRGKRAAHSAALKDQMNGLERVAETQRKRVEAASFEVGRVKAENADRAAVRSAAAEERRKDVEENRTGADVLRRARATQRRRRKRTRTPPDRQGDSD